MNKKLILLSTTILSIIGLASCGNDEPHLEHVDKNKDYICDVCGRTIKHKCIDANGDLECDLCHGIMDVGIIDREPINEPDTFGGYRKVLVPEEGHDYILGFYQTNTLNMIFANGAPHRDGDSDYPFYMGCNKYAYDGANNIGNGVDAGENAMIFNVEYDEGHTKFRIHHKVGTGLEPDYYNGYLQIYGDFNNNVKYSLMFSENVDETYTYTDQNTLTDKEAPNANWFEILETYGGKTVNAIVAMFQNMWDTKVTEPEPTGLGGWGQYENVETVTSNNLTSNMLAHFWEKIPE